MDSDKILKMAFHVIGGLGIFLLGMNYMKEGLQTISGPAFKKLINWITANRFFAIGVGFILTTLVQSSSVTTVMVVGLVNSQLMNLSQAIGVIMGANIGTTVTGWIIAIKIGKWGLPMLGIGAFGTLFVRKEKVKFIAMALLGIGMVFFGLELMSSGFKPIRTMPAFEAWFHAFDASTYFGVLKCALAGCILTFIVQSSSATLGITMTLAGTGVIPFETAAALVLGENIGTTITAFLASFGTGIVAKRAAYFHILFNILGVVWITALFSLYIPLIESLSPGGANDIVMVNGEETFPHIKAHIALVHTLFNIVNTILFIPFVGFFANFLTKVVKGKEDVKKGFLTRLNFHLHETPHVALEQSKHEIVRMDGHIQNMMKNLKTVTTAPTIDKKLKEEIFEREDILDHVQKEITTFLTDVLSDSIAHELALEAQAQLRMADEYESISDEICGILKLHLRLTENKIKLSKVQADELNELHDMVAGYYDFVHTGVQNDADIFMESANNRSNGITRDIRELREKHWGRLSEGKVDPLLSTTYMDIANCYRRIKDYLLNISECLSGKKMV